MRAGRRMWMLGTVMLLLAGDALASVSIAENGAARAVIVHNGLDQMLPMFEAGYRRSGFRGTDEDRVAFEASLAPAKALQHFLMRMTGAELELVATVAEAGDRPAIVLERVARVPGASDGPIGDQAYRLRTEGNRLILSAATDLGLSHAVYGLLEDHLGFRFYSVQTWRGSWGTSGFSGMGDVVVPQQSTLEIAGIDEFQEPSFANRGLIFRQGHYSMLVQNRAIGIPYRDSVSGALAAGHNMYQLLPPEDRMRGDQLLAKGLFADHPEIYPLNTEGERKPDTWNMSICGTAEALPEILARALIGDLPADFDGWVSAGQGDGFAPCHCADCRRVAYENKSEMAPYVFVLNRALEIIGRTHPDLKVITFSYFGSLDAPQVIKPHPNLWVNVVSSSTSANSAGDQMGPIVGNPANYEYERAIREWTQIAPGRVTIWHWDTYRAEWPSMFYVAENMRFMHEAGVYAVNPQTCGGPWTKLLNWLYIKLAWNVDADADALIMQYLEDVFSEAAAPHLWAYLKIGQQAYEDALYVPSAVRWTGWTRMTMNKLFPSSVRTQLAEAMERAEAAVREHGTERQLANLLAKRVESLDTVMLEAAQLKGGPWDFVEHAGRDWYVAGGDTNLPILIARGKQVAASLNPVSRLAREAGGPVVDLQTAAIKARIAPEVAGQVVSAVERASGKELLARGAAEAGYADDFPQMRDGHFRAWLPAGDEDWQPATVWNDFENPDASRLATRTDFGGGRRLDRVVELDEAGGLRITRRYSGDVPGHIGQFNTRWRLALPYPERAGVTIDGAGIRHVMDLRFAEPGGIRLQPGEEHRAFTEREADYMDEAWDTVTAVRDAEVTELFFDAEDGEVHVELDRGDGVAVRLTVPAGGWQAVRVMPAVGEHYLEVVFVGAVPEVPEGGLADAELPEQRLTTRSVPEVAAVAFDAPEAAAPARIRVTGDGTGINEADGAELVWIPEGRFLRGSESEHAGIDERPVREIHLDGYWIYKYPVTVGQYKAILEANGEAFSPMWGQGAEYRGLDPEADENDYMVFVNWYAAERYAQGVGGALPTEAQWEKAARGTDGREFPWGNEWDPSRCVNMENTWHAFYPDRFTRGFRPVQTHPEGASAYGVMQMAGNGWEWVADWYRNEYYAEAPDRNPTGPDFSNVKVVRGGSSLYDWRFARSAARMAQPPEVDNWTPTGFRVVIEAPGPAAQP